MTDLLERTETIVEVTDTGDHDRFSHYFRKTDIEKAFFEGSQIQALCGKVDVPTKDFTKYPVCPQCKEKLESIPE